MRDLPLNVWFAIFAPKGVPAPVRRQLSIVLQQALAEESLRKRGFDAGSLVRFVGPQEVSERLRTEFAGWREAARTANIRLE